jgi:hypothetical protein
VEKAEKTPPDQPLEGQSISISRVLEIMDVRNPRREMFRGRPAIVFDFVGRKDAKTHGLAEDASKKLQGTMWIDEADRQVAHMEVSFTDNFRVGGGLVASVEKGSSFRFDQSLVNGEVWLPTGAEANFQAKVLLLKNVRQHFTERDSITSGSMWRRRGLRMRRLFRQGIRRHLPPAGDARGRLALANCFPLIAR